MPGNKDHETQDETLTKVGPQTRKRKYGTRNHKDGDDANSLDPGETQTETKPNPTDPEAEL